MRGDDDNPKNEILPNPSPIFGPGGTDLATGESGSDPGTLGGDLGLGDGVVYHHGIEKRGSNQGPVPRPFSTRFHIAIPYSARGKSRHGIRPSLHPGGLRCYRHTYSRYACLLFLVCLSSWGGTDCGVSKKGAPCGKSLIFHRGVPGDEGASGLSFQGFQVGMCLFASGGSQGGPAPPAPVNAASGDSRRRAVTQPSSRLGSVAPA